MGFINTILKWYRRYRLIMWLSGILTGVLLPALSYGIHAISLYRSKRLLATDNPEIAGELSLENFWDYLTGLQGVFGVILHVLLVAIIVFLVLLVVAQVLSFIMKRTELSGVDEDVKREARTVKRIQDDVEYDDYGA